MGWDFWRKEPPRPPAPPPPPKPPQKTERGGKLYDVYSRLLKERIIFIGSAIDDEVANVVMAQLLFLQFEDRQADIHLYLNTPGGSVTASLAIYDTMRFVKNDIATYAIGHAVGTGALLLCAGTPGKRFALPRSRIGFADIWGGAQGGKSNIEIHKDEIVRLKKMIFETYAKHTGKTAEWIASEHGTGRFYSAEESIAHGLVDSVIDSAPSSKPPV